MIVCLAETSEAGTQGGGIFGPWNMRAGFKIDGQVACWVMSVAEGGRLGWRGVTAWVAHRAPWTGREKLGLSCTVRRRGVCEA